MDYTVWITQGGQRVAIVDMHDLHLLHAIRHLKAKRGAGPRERVRRRWLIVLKAEAIRRGLDWRQAPSRKVGLLEFVFEQMRKKGRRGTCFHEEQFTADARVILAEAGIAEPEIDVSNLSGRPSYLHWAEGGTPIEGE